MSRGLQFGPVADIYERTRPGYPDELVADVVAALPGSRVVEIGAGTGKATVLLAAHDIELTCVEPDPDMAFVLRERCADWPAVTVVEATFEAFPGVGVYDGLVSAQAWHWTDAATRLDRAARLLRPTGLLALFWNLDEWGTEPVHREIDDIYASHELHGDDRPMCVPDQIEVVSAGPEVELSASPAFDYLGLRTYRWSQEYPARDYTDYLNTTSHHRILAPDVRSRLTADLAAAVIRHGGQITLFRRTDLFLARRRS